MKIYVNKMDKECCSIIKVIGLKNHSIRDVLHRIES